MICKLCKKEGKVRNSHIIPEFLYKTLYDESHRFFLMSTEEGIKTKYLQKGIREKLLCENCEGLFSKYERYASLVLNGAFELKAILEPPVVHYSGFKYSEFKYFALSILWRAGVSSNSDFERVRLGRHEDILRYILLNEETIEEHQYPFILMPILHKDEIVESLIVPPEKTKVGDQHAYLFVFGGIAWVYIVSSHRPPKVVVDASISKSGKVTMLPRQIKDMNYLISYAKQLVGQGKV